MCRDVCVAEAEGLRLAGPLYHHAYVTTYEHTCVLSAYEHTSTHVSYQHTYKKT